MRALFFALGGGLAGYSAWRVMRLTDAEKRAPLETFAAASNEVENIVMDTVEYLGAAILKLSNMRGLDPALLRNANVRAFLRVIRKGEGTSDDLGYQRMFGGKLFSSFADHPRQTNCWTFSSGKKLCSTAAGAYQFLSRTWDETARIMGLTDFSPASQDMGALGRIAARGALPDVLAGRFELALKKVSWEWASMPGSPYGQPVITLSSAREIYQLNGGIETA